MDIDHDKLAHLVYAYLHKTFAVKGRWRDCSDAIQRLWEEAVHESLVRAASQEGNEEGATALLLKRLSTPVGERAPDFYTVAALAYHYSACLDVAPMPPLAV